MIKPSDRIAIITGDREVTFRAMLQHVSHFASFIPAGHPQNSVAVPGDNSKVVIFSENREAWIYALYAIWAKGNIAVPIDATAPAHDVAYILNDCKPQAIWTSRAKEGVVREAIAEAGVEVDVLLMDDFETMEVADMPVAEINYEDNSTALICYTSGTTGSPKGVMLSFINILSNVNAVWKEVNIFSEDTRTLVLLPLHHVLPLVGCAVAPMVVGGGVAISPSLAAADIMGTLQRGKIGIMIGVPRLWQTLFRGIKGKIDANAVTRALYRLCERMQNRTLSRFVFGSVRKKMGGHLRYCVAGGAALDSDTARGLKTLGLDVLEGYGMTETAPIISFTRPGDIRPGCVGLAMPSVEVKLQDGELLARGKNVMQGYFNRPEETAAIIDSEGFVHTGDLATIDATGHITITGRKKEIIVLSNGKNVNPAEIEEKIERYETIVKEAAVTEANDLLQAIIVPQAAWAIGKSEAEIEEQIKREVLQPYNAGVAPYKKLMSLHVYRGDLPRTRLDKLQRFKLRDLLQEPAAPETREAAVAMETMPVEYQMLAEFIRSEKKVEVHPSDNLETDLAMDSLDKVSLQGLIEQNFGVHLSADALAAFPTLAALAEHIAEAKTRTETESIDWHTLLTRPAAGLRLPRMAHTGILFTRLCKHLCRFAFKNEICGLDNIPTEGPFILAPNHQSYLDAPLVVAHLSSATLRQTFFYAKRDHVRGPIMRWLAGNHNIVIMDMRTLKESIRTLGQILADGHNLVIFPEGTRTRTGAVGDFKKTFAILSKELDVPVVPVVIEGAYEAWPRHRVFPRRHPVKVSYLPAIQPEAADTYDTLAERVRQAIVEAMK